LTQKITYLLAFPAASWVFTSRMRNHLALYKGNLLFVNLPSSLHVSWHLTLDTASKKYMRNQLKQEIDAK